MQNALTARYTRLSRHTAILLLLTGSIAASTQAQDVLHVVDDGVGIFTSSPTAPLEISPPAGNAAFRLSAPGGETWVISNTGSIVTFNLIGSGGQEATFRERNDGSGLPSFQVQGTAAATQHVNTSSREVKTGFSAVDPAAVLENLTELPVTQWSYKKDPNDERHIGPVAEDFQTLFGLGDGQHISTVDAAGVAFAAIQALDAKLERQAALIEARDAEIATLRRERDRTIAQLTARLESLETKTD